MLCVYTQHSTDLIFHLLSYMGSPAAQGGTTGPLLPFDTCTGLPPEEPKQPCVGWFLRRIIVEGGEREPGSAYKAAVSPSGGGVETKNQDKY